MSSCDIDDPAIQRLIVSLEGASVAVLHSPRNPRHGHDARWFEE